MVHRPFLNISFLVVVSLLSSAYAERYVGFVDDHDVAEITGLERVLEQAEKEAAPVLVGEERWEQNPYLFGTVFYDKSEKIFKMWYMSYNRGFPAYLRTLVLYATSKDGKTWQKPKLGLFDFEGSTANNIVMGSLGFGDLYSPSVVKDDRATDPFQRYKMIYWDLNGPSSYEHGGMFVAFSGDGLHWKKNGEAPVLKTAKSERALSDVMDVMRDPTTGKFVVYAKSWNNDTWDKKGKVNKEKAQRIIVRTESEDFLQWTTPEPVVRHQLTKDDPQSYGMPVFYDEGLYLGLLRSYKVPGDDTIAITLMSSRDGKKWQRVCPGQTFISTGQVDTAWDDGMIFTAPPLVWGDEILIYYGGWDGPHEGRFRRSAIGLARLPVGRWVGLRAPQKNGGTVLTKPTRAARHLLVNGDAKDGSIRVAAVDSTGKEMAGFGWGDMTPLKDAGLRLPVKWKGGELPAQKDVQLKFEVTGGAALYGFRWEAQEKTKE